MLDNNDGTETFLPESPSLSKENTPCLDIIVLVAGSLTTALALLAVYFLNKAGIELMNYLLWFIIPVGAVIVGIVAGLGYFLGKRFTKAHVSKGLKIYIVLLSIFAYIFAKYLTFQHDIEQIEFLPGQQIPTFLDYIRLIYESIVIEEMDKVSGGTELGYFGYGILIMEIACFCFGALIPITDLDTKDVSPDNTKQSQKTAHPEKP